jgi:superfamily II RNA helicase
MTEGGEDKPRRRLAELLPGAGERFTSDEIFDRFLGWVDERGLSLYPAQEEAILELMAERHVVLSTPTGSGKSLVALALHFKALCEGRRSAYTSPIKALASEKFFDLCEELGADRVGMLTGDASLNPDAPVVCCTAEVLSNMALRRGEDLGIDDVVMDEFHYYSDRERGVAWQIPLIELGSSRFLLMSATLGNMAPISEKLEARTGRAVALVSSDVRPVPLEFEYRETPLHETIEELVATGRSPVYVVSFTQRECSELAQSLTSLKLATREEKDRLWQEVGDFRFDTPYGKELKRFLGFGIAVHHAGLLPKYRLLVEQLAQRGLLRVICGTDTLGVGVNVPIRTVVFTKLCKYDGTQVRILSVRDFKQIAGRAGRKGFDDRGLVVAQAPEHVVENLRIDRKRAEDPGKGKKLVKRKAPTEGFVPWDEATFRKLIDNAPEMLESRFTLSHGMVVDLIQRDAEANDPDRPNFTSLRALIERCHETPVRRAELVGEAARLVRSLARAGILRIERDRTTNYGWVVVDRELQWNFSMFQTLSLFLIEAVAALDPARPEYGLEVLALVEAVLEDPRALLLAQQDRVRSELMAALKAEGVEYEERVERVREATWPKPEADLIYGFFEAFRSHHHWLGATRVSPKGIGRELWTEYLSFTDFVRRYGLARSEGLLLRYLSQLYKTLSQGVPETALDDGLRDLLGFLRTTIEHVDTSLLEEWQSLVHPEVRLGGELERRVAREKLLRWELLHDPKVFRARVRSELHHLVRLLAEEDFEQAAAVLRQDGDGEPWTAERLEHALRPYREAFGQPVRFDGDARAAHRTLLDEVAPKRWRIVQTLADPLDHDDWSLVGWVDLSLHLEGPLFALEGIGPD